MKNRSLVSISDYTLDEQLKILKLAAEFEKKPRQKILEKYVVASLLQSLFPHVGIIKFLLIQLYKLL